MNYSYFFLFALFIFSKTILKGQDRANPREIHQLLTELKTDDDTLKLRLIYEISEIEHNALKSEAYHQKGLELCFKLLKSGEKAKVDKAIAFLPAFINNEGYFADIRGNSRKALMYNFYAHELALRNKDSNILEQTYNNIGYMLYKTTEWKKGHLYFDTALTLSEKMKDYKKIANVLNNAFILCSNENLSGKSKLIEKGLLYLDKFEKANIVETYYNLGYFQILKNDSAASKASLDKAIAIARELENPEYEITSYLYLGHLYARLRVFDKSEQYYLKGYKLAISQNDSSFQEMFSNDLAKLYLKMGRPADADKYAKGRIIDTSFVSKSKKDLIVINLGQLYVQKRLFADSVFQLTGFYGTDHSSSGFKVYVWYYSIAGIILLIILFWWLKRKPKKNYPFDYQ